MIQEAEVVESEQEKENPGNLAGNSAGSMVAMRLAAPGLQFDIKTAVDTDHRIVDLTARLELTCQILAETTSRLEQAHIRIGQLENELYHRNHSD